MEVKEIVKNSFTVIGKLGQGNSNEGSMWIPKLWEDANANFMEISELAKRDEKGNLVGLWGAMSDVDDSFNPWSEQGKYLAGCEVVEGANPPVGWTKWIVPSYRYLVVKCTNDTYGEIFGAIKDSYIPSHGHILVGAVHEYYNPGEAQGNVYLYFPIGLE